MGKFGEKCKQLFQRKKDAFTEDAEFTKAARSKRARNVLRKVRKSVSRFVNDNTDTIVAPKYTEALTENVPDAVLQPLEKSVEHPTSETATNPDQTASPDQGVSSSEDFSYQQATRDDLDHPTDPAVMATESNVQSEQAVPQAGVLGSSEGPSPKETQDHSELNFTIILSPPDSTDSPDTSNGDSQARYTSSCYSTPTPKSRFNRTPETPQSPESTYLCTPHDSNSYLKLLHDSSRLSTTVETSDRYNTACAPHVTNTETLGIFERSVGSGPEGPNPFLNLAQVLAEHAEPEKKEAIVPVEGAAEVDGAEQPAPDTADNDDEPAGDRASIKSGTPSAWERAMESQE
ncbi:MAG: hypothetical protein L6R42_009705, partial [Xanthoria sp. 1 TBL-2021]